MWSPALKIYDPVQSARRRAYNNLGQSYDEAKDIELENLLDDLQHYLALEEGFTDKEQGVSTKNEKQEAG